MDIPIIRFLLISSMILATSIAYSENTNNRIEENVENKSKILSRKKRFLTFPDGSSFQLVFCAQNHGYLQVGDVVWFGNTAALAWELPSDPSLFHYFKDHEKVPGQRRQDSRHVVYLDENGRVISTVPYKRKYIVNPAFAKRSIDVSYPENKVKQRISVKEMHEMHTNRSLFHDLDEKATEFHREARKSLYDKLEKFFEALGWRGKECVLRLLCETGTARNIQGNFLEELFRVTFTFPRSDKSSEHYKKYDQAHSSTGDCASLYPDCEGHHEMLNFNSSHE